MVFVAGYGSECPTPAMAAGNKNDMRLGATLERRSAAYEETGNRLTSQAKLFARLPICLFAVSSCGTLIKF